MTAKGNCFTLLIAAVRIPAVVTFKFDQRKMARIDLDTAKFSRFDLQACRLPWLECGQADVRDTRLRRFGPRGVLRQQSLQTCRLTGVRKPHSLGTS